MECTETTQLSKFGMFRARVRFREDLERALMTWVRTQSWHCALMSVVCRHSPTYPISSLTDVVGRHDFTIAIVAADDQLVSRGEAKHVPRDNVQLEYGISVGMLGRERSILLVDTDENVKLASDQPGLTTPRFDGSDLEWTIQKACIAARKHITDLGPLQNRPRTAA